MSNILIIGNSPAVVAAIEEIRRMDAESTITLFCPEQVLPYNRTLLPAFVAKDIKESQVFITSEKFFLQHKVQVIVNETLTRISTKRNQITTESKAHFSFDKLLIINMPAVKLPAIKGHQKKGIFDVFSLPKIREIIKYLPFADNIIVPVTTFAGLDMACAVSRAGKSVIVLCPEAGLLADIFDDDTAALLKQIVEVKGMRVMAEQVEEILGESEVKAVRFKSGKVIAAEMVLFDQAGVDLRLLAESGIIDKDQIAVGEFFNTPVENIFACDAALGAFDLVFQESVQQGRCAAANMLNLGSLIYQPPVLVREFGTKICDGFCGGYVRIVEGGREQMRFDGPTNVYKKIYLSNGLLVGAVWFNAPGDKENVLKALAEKTSLAGMEDQFLQSTNLS